MSLLLTARQIRGLRMRAQRLDPVASDHPSTPEGAVEAMFGAQAQELPAALLSVRARSRGLTAAQVEQARVGDRPSGDRRLVWTWLMRGTLHLVSAGDARWLLPLLGPSLIAGDRGRMQQLGWDDQRTLHGLRLLEQALAARGTLTRAQLMPLLAEQGLPHEGQAPVHLLFRAAAEGLLCAGPMQGKDPAYVPLAGWLGALAPLPREEALARLAQRYLAAFGPAAPRDLAAWSGLAQREARQGWQAISEPLEEIRLEGAAAQDPGPLWLLQSQLSALQLSALQLPALEGSPQRPAVRLLSRFDTLWMGYASRDLLVDPAYAGRVNAGGGIVHPMLLVDGQVRGVWKAEQKRGALVVRVMPFAPLEDGVMPGLEAEAADIARFRETDARLEVAAPA